MTELNATYLLHLLWLASPALPVGGFSYSEGLEAAVDAGVVHDEASAGDWLLNQLELVQARAELPVAAAAHAATLALDGARLAELNAWVLQTRETSESLQQAQQMGRSLLIWMQGLMPEATVLPLLKALKPAPTWPVVMGAAAASRGAALEPALQAIAFGWAENLMQAAIRGVPLGQTAGQRLLAGLVHAIPQAVAAAMAAPEPMAFAPLLGIHGARHETQYSRLFRS
ncbi:MULTISPECIES: urease accessory protein UreF [unclassified Roseateles]|uniref:urease accessory protein UreF n=1 Tax=unclassified Roseateles TaxID=2626991 RepID=UPI0006FD899F|nr:MULTISPECIES: urease accessory UreF family protein [unclassified Roseateles]KQW49822.1 urease accessory protein UreF [Pelomonas sp. Root405]KRA76489.1 urease accessory protein UreF [Pelomonas sp. Root662]